MRDLDVQTLTRLANELFSGSSAPQTAPSALDAKALEPKTFGLNPLDPKRPEANLFEPKGLPPNAFAPQGADPGAVASKGVGVAPNALAPSALEAQGSALDGAALRPAVSAAAPHAELGAPRVPALSGVGPAGIGLSGLDFSSLARSGLSLPGLDLPELGLPLPPAAAPSPTQLGAAALSAPSFYFLEHVREPAVASSTLSAFESTRGAAPFDVLRVKRDFPILSERVNGRPLVWLDNAATTQKPSAVIERIRYFYEHENSNIHRAAHELAARATDAYEDAREKVRAFLNASSTREIVFLRGATEAINLVAQTFGRVHVGKDDEIVVSHLEHHANIVPWQQLAEATGAKLRVIPVDDDGQLLLDEYGKLLGPRTKLVAVTQVSNALGTVTDAKQIVDMAHAVGARVLIDGAQAVSHMPVDVRALDADFYVFSGHKVFAPTGIGVLYGKADLLDELPPWQGGGNMIEDVTFEHTRYQNSPARFEAGTGNIADAVGLGAAVDYVTRLGMPLVEAYEQQLLAYGTALLANVPGLRLIGTAAHKAGVLSFVLEGFRTDEVSSALNEHGIAVRGGHHCAQPILRRFGLESTVRPSLAFYNDCADLDALAQAILRIKSRRTTSVAVPSLHGF